MLKNQKLEHEKSLLSEDEIAKTLHSFDAITNNKEKLNRLWDKVLDENRKKRYREFAKALSGKIKKPKAESTELVNKATKAGEELLVNAELNKKTEKVEGVEEKIKKIIERHGCPLFQDGKLITIAFQKRIRQVNVDNLAKAITQALTKP